MKIFCLILLSALLADALTAVIIFRAAITREGLPRIRRKSQTVPRDKSQKTSLLPEREKSRCSSISKLVSPWERGDMFTSRERRFEEYGDVFANGREWLSEAGRGPLSEELSVVSTDGLRLSGRMIKNPVGRGMILMCHGYRSNPVRDFGAQARCLYGEGFSLLMIDQRAHGGSEGKFISYGVNERFDIVEWCRLLDMRFPGVPVVLYGVSMGAAAVLMAVGLPSLPPNVRAAAADCGFTTPGEILRYVMRRRHRIPAFPVYWLLKAVTRTAAGFSLDEADTRESLRKCTVPILIAHGTRDSLVPFYMSEENRDVCEAIFFKAAGAEHLCAFAADPDEYMTAFRRLLGRAGLCEND